MPRPPHLSFEESNKRAVEGMRRYWAVEGPRREAARAATIASAAGEIGELSDRELRIAGAVAYWCEGTKGKPRHREDKIAFTNSDPGLIKLFLRFLQATGVEPERITYRVAIHETADIAAAERFWADVTGTDVSRFKKPTIKRHNPKTVRKNVGDGYHGCLVIGVLRGAELYQKIEGWVLGAVGGVSVPI
jgi:hypothetical protein